MKKILVGIMLLTCGSVMAAPLTPGKVPRAKTGSILMDGTIYDNGNIGIGSTVPRAKLDVDGPIYATTFYGSGAGLTGLPSGMTYPDAGIAVSTGSAWGTSLTDSSANWDTAYGWGNHASAGYVPGTRTVNGKALSSNITLTQGDIDLSLYATTASLSGYVPVTITVNSKPLSSNIVLTQGDIDLSLYAPKASPTFTGTIGTPLTASRCVQTDASGNLSVSTDVCGTGGGGGYTNLTSFVDQTAWRLFYSNGSGDVTELGLGTAGQVLKSAGASSAPAFGSVTQYEVDLSLYAKLLSPTFTTPILGAATGTTLTTSGNVGIGTTDIGNGVIVYGRNVGIGTTNPNTLLGVGSTNQFKVSNTGAVTSASIYNTGNIGIGTSNPGVSLGVGSTNQFNVTSAGAVTAVSFSGPLTGNVTGNVSGSSGSTTGNAATVTNGVYTTGAGTVYLAPNGSAASLTSFPTLNQNTTGTAAGLTAQYIDWSSGSGGNSIANKPTLGAMAAGAYPGSGIANSSGSAWGTSYTTSGSGTVVALTNSPEFTTPNIGVATATSVNKLTITAPATSATLTIANGKTLTATNTVNLNTMTDSKWCKYSTSGTAIDCNVDPVTAVTADNPTVNIGLSTTNGSASTFMRSDAAPKIDVAIAPTWTGNHTFTPSSGDTKITAGNVGIGTYTPTQKLDVDGAIYARGTGNTLLAPSGGNVGIGSSSPGRLLDVAGSIEVDTYIYTATHYCYVSGTAFVCAAR